MRVRVSGCGVSGCVCLCVVLWVSLCVPVGVRVFVCGCCSTSCSRLARFMFPKCVCDHFLSLLFFVNGVLVFRVLCSCLCFSCFCFMIFKTFDLLSFSCFVILCVRHFSRFVFHVFTCLFSSFFACSRICVS